MHSLILYHLSKRYIVFINKMFTLNKKRLRVVSHFHVWRTEERGSAITLCTVKTGWSSLREVLVEIRKVWTEHKFPNIVRSCTSHHAATRDEKAIFLYSFFFFFFFCLWLLFHTKRVKGKGQGFPCGSVVKNPPAKAGDMSSIPGPGKSHMPWSDKASVPQPLSLGSRTREQQQLKPTCPRACALQQEKPLQREAHALQLESSPWPPQLKKALVHQWRTSTPIQLLGVVISCCCHVLSFRSDHKLLPP